MSVNPHLTPGGSVHPENDIMYLTGNEGQNTCVDFSETAPLQRYTTSCIVWLYVQSAICAVCCMCSLLYVQSAVCAVCCMCSLLYVQSAVCAVCCMCSWPFEKKHANVSTTTWCRLDWAPRVCTLVLSIVLSIEYLSYLTSVKEHMEF